MTLALGQKKQYEGNGAATNFSFPYYFTADADLVVIHRTTAGVETIPVLDTDYTVTGEGTLLGNVEFPKGGSSYSTLAADEYITILRVMDLTEDTDLSGAYQWDTLNLSKDTVMMIIQQLQEQIDRCIKMPRSDLDSLDMELVNSIDRASKILGFDTNGEPSATTNITNEGMGASIPLTAPGASLSQGDGANYFVVPSFMDGMNLSRANIVVGTAGSTGSTTIDIYNVTKAADMLSTAITLASGATVGTVGVIDTANDHVNTNDLLRFDVTTISTTAPVDAHVAAEFLNP